MNKAKLNPSVPGNTTAERWLALPVLGEVISLLMVLGSRLEGTLSHKNDSGVVLPTTKFALPRAQLFEKMLIRTCHMVYSLSRIDNAVERAAETSIARARFTLKIIIPPIVDGTETSISNTPIHQIQSLLFFLGIYVVRRKV